MERDWFADPYGTMPGEEDLPGCPSCGVHPSETDERAEVVNRSTGARSIAHVECYLAERDQYEPA